MTTLVKSYKSTITINLPAAKQAEIIKSVLEVDEELQPERMSRSFEVRGNQLVV